jgi:hypothetical protein
LDAIDSALLPENERRASLCLDPFSREFYTATGHSKLQLPDDYLELVRVIVWHNRQRIKMGMDILAPSELENFLHEEMSQDFRDLGIEIEDFLADLTKIRQEESLAFDIFNKWVQKTEQAPKNTPNIDENSSTNAPATVTKASDTPSPPSKTLFNKFVKASQNIPHLHPRNTLTNQSS